MKNEDVWFEARSPAPDQEAAGFARKLDNAEEDSLMALSL